MLTFSICLLHTSEVYGSVKIVVYSCLLLIFSNKAVHITLYFRMTTFTIVFVLLVQQNNFVSSLECVKDYGRFNLFFLFKTYGV